MPATVKITKDKQILVEGNDAKCFMYPFLEYCKIDYIQIHDFGGISDLTSFLQAFILMPGFDKVKSIGIIRDAELNATSAFQSVCSSLSSVKLPVPAKPGKKISNGKITVNTFILPNNQDPGMLESLVNSAIQNEPVFDCIQKYLTCITEKMNNEPTPKDKTILRSYLASKPNISPLTGFAARSGYLNFHNQNYNYFKEFLFSL
jgi:hypothetical protein